jgi:hypothetical protein
MPRRFVVDVRLGASCEQQASKEPAHLQLPFDSVYPGCRPQSMPLGEAGSDAIRVRSDPSGRIFMSRYVPALSFSSLKTIQRPSGE